MTQKATPGIHVIPKPPAKKPAQVTDEWLQEIAPVLDRKEKAPNEFVGYLVEQVNAANDERTALLANLKQADLQIKRMRDAVTALDGQVKARLQDMLAWWDRAPMAAQSDMESVTKTLESES
jgi:hypothetical protein